MGYSLKVYHITKNIMSGWWGPSDSDTWCGLLFFLDRIVCSHVWFISSPSNLRGLAFCLVHKGLHHHYFIKGESMNFIYLLRDGLCSSGCQRVHQRYKRSLVNSSTSARSLGLENWRIWTFKDYRTFTSAFDISCRRRLSLVNRTPYVGAWRLYRWRQCWTRVK